MQELPPKDPIAAAASASVNYTPQMHAEARDRLLEQIHASKQSSRVTEPLLLDLYETAIYHAAHTDDPEAGLYLYDDKLGGYEHLGGRLGDYRRGLRITAFLMKILRENYMDVLACPAHDHNLYLIALGQPEAAEQQTRRLLQHARDLAQSPSNDQVMDNWNNPLRMFQPDTDRGFVMYEAVFLQTRCDALLAQGKLQDAEMVMNEVLDQPREWKAYGQPLKRRNGSNPYARRALARALSGDVKGAFDDFKAADRFSENYTLFTLFPSRDWHHRTLYAAFLARLGYLSGAQRQIDQMNIERIRAYRPLTTAEFDLASAEIAYAHGDRITAENHAQGVVKWAAESGHQQIHLRASLILAKLRLRAQEFDEAIEFIDKLQIIATESGFELQRLDGLVLTGYWGLATGDIQRSKAAADEVALMSERLLYRWCMGDAAHLLARCAEAQSLTDEALEHGKRALSIREQIRDPKITYTRALIERNSLNPDSL